MFHEALKYEEFRDIIGQHTYYAEYTDAAGEEKGVMWESTNHYFINEAVPPSDVMVSGGKTGTTDQAGNCLILLDEDMEQNRYISVIMGAETKEILYMNMTSMIDAIPRV